MKNLTFTPEPVIAEQLQELARITQRPIGDLINDLLDSPLDQMLGEQQDTDYMRLVLDDVVYSDQAQAPRPSPRITMRSIVRPSWIRGDIMSARPRPPIGARSCSLSRRS
jgi:hypothetical protein